MPKNEVRAYRGYYVNMDNIIPVITQLLIDAEQRKHKIVIIGNDERAKLDGAIMSLHALKEALYNLEVFGDLIPQPDPVKEVPNVESPEVEKAVEQIKADAETATGIDPALFKDKPV